jgi:Ca-activated chloride channel homolog
VENFLTSQRDELVPGLAALEAHARGVARVCSGTLRDCVEHLDEVAVEGVADFKTYAKDLGERDSALAFVRMHVAGHRHARTRLPTRARPRCTHRVASCRCLAPRCTPRPYAGRSASGLCGDFRPQLPETWPEQFFVTRSTPAALVDQMAHPIQLPSPSRVSALFPTTAEGASSGAELVTTDGRSLALTHATLTGEAGGGISRLVLEQTFANPYAEILNVTYRMPLPADGAVSGYEFAIGERTVKGVVDKKHQARARFEKAIASGHTAALLEQVRADIFTQQIGNIPAGERVIARISIDMRLAWLPEGEWELRFPTVIAPRYIGSADSVADAKATHVKVSDQPLPITFQIAMTISDAITAGAKPNSPTHALSQIGDKVTLTSGTRLDRDIVVRWPVAAASPGLSLQTARRREGDAFGLVTIVPPARAAKQTPVARDLLVLLDTSGSMGGAPLDKAKQVVSLMINSLDDRDQLELIEFSSEPKRWRDTPEPATPKTRAAAIKWVQSRSASGGTEMRAAVIESLSTLRIGAQRQVLIVTDGYVGGEQQILEALHRKLPRSCRLHVLGVGSAVNRSIATALARAGRGAEVIVGPDEDAERGAKRLLDRTRLPMLTNVEIAGSALIRHAPEKIPDVFEGAPLVAALAINPDGGELVVRGQLANETWEQRIRVPANKIGEGNQAIAALYGRERVADVEAHMFVDTANGEVEELGMMFQIATRMTSWIAVDDSTTVSGPFRDELVPQELPYGTSAQAFGLRGSVPGMVPMESMAYPQAQVGSARLMKTRAGGIDFESEDTGAGAAPSGMVSRAKAPAEADDESDEAFEEQLAASPTGTRTMGSSTPMDKRISKAFAEGPEAVEKLARRMEESGKRHREAQLPQLAEPVPMTKGKYLRVKPKLWHLAIFAILIALVLWYLLA